MRPRFLALEELGVEVGKRLRMHPPIMARVPRLPIQGRSAPDKFRERPERRSHSRMTLGLPIRRESGSPASMESNLDSREGAYVARQPILDASGQVFGYELLYRAAADAESCVDSRDLAAARVLSDAVLTLGLDTLTGGRRRS